MQLPERNPATEPILGTERTPVAVTARLAQPFAWAFTVTIAVMLALSLGGAVVSLAGIMLSVTIAMFFALALDPLVRGLERRGQGRGASIGIVFAAFIVVVGTMLAFVVPATVEQVVIFAQSVPGYIADFRQSAVFEQITGGAGEQVLIDQVVTRAQTWLSDPANLLSLGGGIVAFGSGLINAISTTMIVIVLTLYFLASMDSMKQGLYSILPAYRRAGAAEMTEQITGSVGGFVAGQIQMSSMNAAFTFILLTILGVPYAVMLAFAALFVTLIPMIGSVLMWIISFTFCLLGGWVPALIFAVVYFAYMQVEAYVVTPKIMSKAVSVPGSLVLIGAMVGGTLGGLVGALMAVPITASILLVVRGVLIPRQDARTVAPYDALHDQEPAAADTATDEGAQA